MPLLDVSIAILDPMFLDEVQLTRFVQTVGSNGRAVNAPTTTTIYGVVTNDAGHELKRTTDASQVGGSIMFHTLEKLDDGTLSTEADVITWDGVAYTVDNVGNYSRYGAGFTMNRCVPVPVQGGA